MRGVLFFVWFCQFTTQLMGADIFETRLRELSRKGLPFFYNEQVKAEIDYWLHNEDGYTAFLLGKTEATTAYIEEALLARKLPAFLRHIPIANTNLAYDFYGKDGASGAWPMNFAIAKKYNLKVNSYVDERRSTGKAANAAAAYLADLYHIYRDWNLVIAAFRAGPVEVNKAIRLAGNTLNYDSIHPWLPEPYQQAVVRFMGVMYAWNFYNMHNIQAKKYIPEAVDTVWSACGMTFSSISQGTGIGMEDLRFFNPVLRGEFLPYTVESSVLYLPAGKAARFLTFRDSFCAEQQRRIIARGSPETENQVQYDTIIRMIDSVTYIEVKPRETTPALPPAPAPNETRTWVFYTVKQGDGLYLLADIFDCSIAQAKKWNGLSSNTITAGRKLKFYVPANQVTFYKKLNSMSLLEKRQIAARD
jgi:membrane-bound lytic murein transglycosylase D